VFVSEAEVAEDSVVVSFMGGGGPFWGVVSLSDIIARVGVFMYVWERWYNGLRGGFEAS